MKILAIRGRNLASLEGEFCLDFTVEPLLSAGIFAICGPTGAGKSTLLDALCLALFGRTPRTDQARENSVKLKDVQDDLLLQSDPRFLLRRGTASGYAETDFVALNGLRYRSRWAVSRARDKENGRLQSPRIALYNLDKETEEGGSRSDLQARVIELIGLTFEQFTRSVLLAQNDFSTFLKAEQSEKASLLEKLTGTEQYSAISRMIFQKNGEAKEAYEKVLAQIQGIELLSEEEEALFRARLTEAENRLVHLEKAKTERHTLQEVVKSAGQQQEIKCRQQKEVEEQWTQAREKVAAARQAYEKGKEEQAASELRFKSLQAELQEARKLDVQIESATRVASEAAAQQREAEVRKKENETRLRRLEERWKQGEKERVQLAAWRQKYQGKQRIAEQLSALLVHLDAAWSARQGIEKADQALAGYRRQAETIAANLVKVQQAVETSRNAIRQTEDKYRELMLCQKETDLSALEKEKEVVRSEREQLLIEQARGDIGELRKGLRPGVPCPVCGSLHHPVAEGTERFQTGLFEKTGKTEAKPDEGAFTQRIDSLTLRLKTLADETEAYHAREKQLAQWQQRQLALQKELTESEQAGTVLAGQQKLLFNQQAREEAARGEQGEVLAKSLEAADLLFGNETWQAGWKKDPAGFRQTLTGFGLQWKEREERLRQLEPQQAAWQAEYESFASLFPTFEKEYETIRLDCEKKQASLHVFQAERRKLLGGRPADDVEKEQARTQELLQERLKNLQIVQNEQSLIAEQSGGRAGQIARDLAELSVTERQAREELAAWEEAYRTSSGGVSLEEALAAATQSRTECMLRLRVQAENKRKIAAWQEELARSRADSERWGKLNELAGSADGAKFRRIAQGYTLDMLLSYTNVQLRLLTRRYRLERVPDTLALQVIDRDMCDEIRTVHSLSGGESFLVSLALALGLSSLSSNRMKVESLFIDEGFGSLDADTLRVAMDALENLRTQGRKIGVISHVQEMTERIPVRVRVNRAGNGRSYLEIE